MGPRRLSGLTRPSLLGHHPVSYSPEGQEAKNREKAREARPARLRPEGQTEALQVLQRSVNLPGSRQRGGC